MFIASTRKRGQSGTPKTRLISSTAGVQSPPTAVPFAEAFGGGVPLSPTFTPDATPSPRKRAPFSAFDQQYCASPVSRLPQASVRLNATQYTPKRPLSACSTAKRKETHVSPSPHRHLQRPSSARSPTPHYYNEHKSGVRNLAVDSGNTRLDDEFLTEAVPVMEACIGGSNTQLDESGLSTVTATVLEQVARDEASRASILGERSNIDGHIAELVSQFGRVSEKARAEGLRKLKLESATTVFSVPTQVSLPANEASFEDGGWRRSSADAFTSPFSNISEFASRRSAAAGDRTRSVSVTLPAGPPSPRKGSLLQPSGSAAFDFMKARKKKIRADELTHQTTMLRRRSLASSGTMAGLSLPSPSMSVSPATTPRHRGDPSARLPQPNSAPVVAAIRPANEAVSFKVRFPFVTSKLLSSLDYIRNGSWGRAVRHHRRVTYLKDKVLVTNVFTAWRDSAIKSKWLTGLLIHRTKGVLSRYRLKKIFETWRRSTLVAWYIESIWLPTQQLKVHPLPLPRLTVKEDLPRFEADLKNFLDAADSMSPWAAAQRERAALSRLTRAKKIAAAANEAIGAHQRRYSFNGSGAAVASSVWGGPFEDTLQASIRACGEGESVLSRLSMADIASGLTHQNSDHHAVVNYIEKLLEEDDERERNEEAQAYQRQADIDRTAHEEAMSIMAAMSRVRALADSQSGGAAGLLPSAPPSVPSNGTSATTTSKPLPKPTSAAPPLLKRKPHGCSPEVTNHVWNEVMGFNRDSSTTTAEKRRVSLEIQSDDDSSVSDAEDDADTYCFVREDGTLGRGEDVGSSGIHHQGGMGNILTAKARIKRVHDREAFMRPSWRQWRAYIFRRREKKIANGVLVIHTNTVLRAKRLRISMTQWQKALQAALSTSYFAVKFKASVLKRWRLAVSKRILIREDEAVADRICQQRLKATSLTHWMNRVRQNTLQLYAGTAAALVNKRVLLEAIYAWQAHPYVSAKNRQESLSENARDLPLDFTSKSDALEQRFAYSSRLQISCFTAWRSYVKRCRRYGNFQTQQVENFAVMLVTRAFYVWRSRGQCDWTTLERAQGGADAPLQQAQMSWDLTRSSSPPPTGSRRRLSVDAGHGASSPTPSDLPNMDYDLRPPIGALSALALVQPTAALLLYNVSGGISIYGGGAAVGTQRSHTGGDTSLGAGTWRTGGGGRSGANIVASPSASGLGSMTYSSSKDDRLRSQQAAQAGSAQSGWTGGGPTSGAGLSDQTLAARSLYAIPPIHLTKAAVREFVQTVLASLTTSSSPYDPPALISTGSTQSRALIAMFDHLLLTPPEGIALRQQLLRRTSTGSNDSAENDLPMRRVSLAGGRGLAAAMDASDISTPRRSGGDTAARWNIFQPILAPTVTYSWSAQKLITLQEAGLAAAAIVTDPMAILSSTSGVGGGNRMGYVTTQSYTEMSIRLTAASGVGSPVGGRALSPPAAAGSAASKDGSTNHGATSLSDTARSRNNKPPTTPSAGAAGSMAAPKDRGHLFAAFLGQKGATSPNPEATDHLPTRKRLSGTITAAIAHKMFDEEITGTPPPAVYPLLTALFKNRTNALNLTPPSTVGANPLMSSSIKRPSVVAPRPPGAAGMSTTVTIVDASGSAPRAGAGRRHYSLFSNATIKNTTASTDASTRNLAVPASPTLSARRTSSPNSPALSGIVRVAGTSSAFHKHDGPQPGPTVSEVSVDGYAMRNCFVRYVLQRLGLSLVTYTAINASLRKKKAKSLGGKVGTDPTWTSLGEELIATQQSAEFTTEQASQQRLIAANSMSSPSPPAPIASFALPSDDGSGDDFGAISNPFLGIASAMERHVVDAFLAHHSQIASIRKARRQARLGEGRIILCAPFLEIANEARSAGVVSARWASLRLGEELPPVDSPDALPEPGRADSPSTLDMPCHDSASPAQSPSTSTHRYMKATGVAVFAVGAMRGGEASPGELHRRVSAGDYVQAPPMSRRRESTTSSGSLGAALVTLLNRLREYSKVAAALDEGTWSSYAASVIKSGFGGIPHGSHVMLGIALRRQEEIEALMAGNSQMHSPTTQSQYSSRLRLKSNVQDTGRGVSSSPQKRTVSIVGSVNEQLQSHQKVAPPSTRPTSRNSIIVAKKPSIPAALQLVGWNNRSPSSLNNETPPQGWAMFGPGAGSSLVSGSHSALAQASILTGPAWFRCDARYSAVEAYLDYQCCKRYGAGDVVFLQRVARLGLQPTLEATRRERLLAQHVINNIKGVHSDSGSSAGGRRGTLTAEGGQPTEAMVGSGGYLSANASVLFALAAAVPSAALQASLIPRERPRPLSAYALRSTGGGGTPLRQSPSSQHNKHPFSALSATVSSPQSNSPSGDYATPGRGMDAILVTQPSATHHTRPRSLSRTVGSGGHYSTPQSPSTSLQVDPLSTTALPLSPATITITGGASDSGSNDERQARIKVAGSTLLLLVQSLNALVGFNRCVTIQSRMRRRYLFTRYECAASAARFLHHQQPLTLTQLTGAPSSETHRAEAVLAAQSSGATTSARKAAMSEATTGAAAKGAAKQRGSKTAWAPESEYGQRQSQPHYAHYSVAAVKQRTFFEDGKHLLSALGASDDSSGGEDNDDESNNSNGDENVDLSPPKQKTLDGCVVIAPTRPRNRNRRLVELKQGMGQTVGFEELLATLSNRAASKELKARDPGTYYHLLSLRRDINSRGASKRAVASSRGGGGFQSIFDAKGKRGATRTISIYADHLALDVAIHFRVRLERRLCERILSLTASGDRAALALSVSESVSGASTTIRKRTNRLSGGDGGNIANGEEGILSAYPFTLGNAKFLL